MGRPPCDLVWLQLEPGDGLDAPAVGQLVVSWHAKSETVALLEHLEFDPGTPHGAVEELVLAGVQGAADAGAHIIEHRPNDAEHIRRGLPSQQEDGMLRLDAADVP